MSNVISCCAFGLLFMCLGDAAAVNQAREARWLATVAAVGFLGYAYQLYGMAGLA